jgi:hypothetical protein
MRIDGPITRRLRFRLTAGYVLFFAVLLGGVAAVFQARLRSVLDDQVRNLVNQQWATMKGYLRIEKNAQAFWYYDADDDDENRTALNIKRVYFIADGSGNLIREGPAGDDAISREYEAIGVDPAPEIRARVRQALATNPSERFYTERRDKRGAHFLIRSGIVFDELHQSPATASMSAPYYVSIGIPLTQYRNISRQFTLIFAAVIPVALILGLLLGWFMPGRASD